ncbi:MAG: ABC transporter ATP-binding protein [Kiritimatiellia bacterium]
MQTEERAAMIRVSQASRHFGRLPAVRDISFEVGKGEIVGLLGPNGAGKTTTLRMLAGFLRPTAGQVFIDGVDGYDGEEDVRNRVGYLPENTPLYGDMRVQEYLAFRGRLKGMPRRYLRARIDAVLVICDLRDRARSLIRTLSKGYRQRVGLADCLLHEPPCLVLDEPTIGLDPNQIRQVRTLIQSFAENHTILLSTHILSEAELLCDRVLIMNRGSIIAADTPAALAGLRQGGEHIVAEVAGVPAAVAAATGTLAGVQDLHCTVLSDGWIRITMLGPGRGVGREQLYRLVSEKGWKLRELRAEVQHLEDVFAALTGSDAFGEGLRA